MDKKILAGIATLSLLVLPAISFAENYISIDATFVEDAMAYVGQIFTDLNLLIVLAVGLPLGFWVIRKVITLVRVRA